MSPTSLGSRYASPADAVTAAHANDRIRHWEVEIRRSDVHQATSADTDGLLVVLECDAYLRQDRAGDGQCFGRFEQCRAVVRMPASSVHGPTAIPTAGGPGWTAQPTSSWSPKRTTRSASPSVISGARCPLGFPPIMSYGFTRDAWEVFLQAVMDRVHDLEPKAPTRRVRRPRAPSRASATWMAIP